MSTRTKDLLELLRKAKSDSDRLSIMLELIEIYSKNDFLEGWKLANETLELATKMSDDDARAKAFEGMATSAWKLADYSVGLEHFADALTIYRRNKDLYGTARCYCGMGIICGSNEEYQQALEYFEEALVNSKLAERPELTATVTGNIGHVYFNFGRYRDAMDCFRLASDYYEDLNNELGAANMLSGMAGVHVYLGEFQRGLDLIRKSTSLHKRAKHDQGVSVSMMNTGITLHRMGKIDEAEVELLEALNFTRSVNFKQNETNILSHLRDLYKDKGQDKEQAKYQELYDSEMREEKKASLKRKNDQLKQREIIKSMRKRA